MKLSLIAPMPAAGYAYYLLNRLGRFLTCNHYYDENLTCNEKSFDVGVNSFAFILNVTFPT